MHRNVKEKIEERINLDIKNTKKSIENKTNQISEIKESNKELEETIEQTKQKIEKKIESQYQNIKSIRDLNQSTLKNVLGRINKLKKRQLGSL